MSERSRNIASVAFIVADGGGVGPDHVDQTGHGGPSGTDRDADQMSGVPGRVDRQLPLADGGRHDGPGIGTRLRWCARRGDCRRAPGLYTGAVLLDPPASGATLVALACSFGRPGTRHCGDPVVAAPSGLGGRRGVGFSWAKPDPTGDRWCGLGPGLHRNRGSRRQLTPGSPGRGSRSSSHRRAGLVRREQRDHGGGHRRQRGRSAGQRDAPRSGRALLR